MTQENPMTELAEVAEETTAEAEDRRAFVLGLRELADVFERSPDLPLPFSLEASIFTYDAESFADAVKSVPGKLNKRTWGEKTSSPHMEVNRHFGPIKLSISAPRSTVCTPRIVGQENVEVEEVVTPAVTETKLVERDVIQWDCEPILQREAGEPNG